MRGRSFISHNDWVRTVSARPGAINASNVGSIRGSPLCHRSCVLRNIHPPPTMIHAQDTAPDTTPLCQGERMNRIALHGHQTNVGTMNHPW